MAKAHSGVALRCFIAIPTQIVRRVTAASPSNRYWVIGCVCLVVVAAALRFYDLGGHMLRFDEAKAALNSIGAISEVLDNTRYENSSPILYPMALWAVQKAASTEFSVRFAPAAASALMVGALLFLLPRVGVARRAAFLAALLAALSTAAIANAHDAREYSVDALAAVLIIAGTLRYLRDGGKWLLCGALFAGPLLQYGLILFGAAALGAAALAPVASAQGGEGGGRGGFGAAVWRRIRQRIDLLLPIGCFAAACAISWTLTASYQWTAGGWGSGDYLTDYYYQGGFQAAAVAGFAIGRTWDLLIYHMPPNVAAAALLGFAGLLPWAARRRRLDGVALLALLAVGIALCAALASAYPFGDIRQCLYLGPIIFLAAGAAFHKIVGAAAAWGRQGRLAPALTGVAACAIALAGASEIWRYYNEYQAMNGIGQIFAALEAREREGDGVYVSHWGVPIVDFYKKERPDNYYYSTTFCWDPSGRECVSEMFDELFRAFGGARRIWLIHAANAYAQEETAAYSQGAAVEEVAANSRVALHLISRRAEAAEGVAGGATDARAGYEKVADSALIAAAEYNLYTQDNTLYYAKEACAPSDVEERFFLHIYPEDATGLPAHYRRHEYANIDFDFYDYGVLADGKCFIQFELPEYPVDLIHTGQYIYPDGAVTWETRVPFRAFDSEEWLAMYEGVVSVAPSAAADYNLYIQDEALYYAKRPCVPADVEERFFLRVYPEDANDVPPGHHHQHGYESFYFKFHDYGFLAFDRCLIRRELPGYRIDRIHTGQFIYPDGGVTWEWELPFER